MSACRLVQTLIFVLSSVNLEFFPSALRFRQDKKPVPWAIPRKIRILDPECSLFFPPRGELDVSFQSYHVGGSGKENYNE